MAVSEQCKLAEKKLEKFLELPLFCVQFNTRSIQFENSIIHYNWPRANDNRATPSNTLSVEMPVSFPAILFISRA